MQRILSREQNWLKWKNSSCPAFEKESADDSAIPGLDQVLETMQATGNKAAHLTTKKRKWSDVDPDFINGIKDVNFVFDCSDANIKETAKRLVASFPDFESQIMVRLSYDFV